jgi:integrase
MNLPAPAKQLPPRLRKKLEAAWEASLGNVSSHTERSYRRGLVVFALWLCDNEMPLPIGEPPSPRAADRHEWELRAMNCAGVYLCSLDKRSAVVLVEAYLYDLLYGDSPSARTTVEQRLAALRWAMREAWRLDRVTWQLDDVQLPRVRKGKGGRLVEKAGRDMRGPQPEDAVKLIEAARAHADPRALPIMSLLRYEGYREHEIRQIDIDDLDVEKATVMLVRKMRDKASAHPLSGKSLDAILRWMAHHPSPSAGPLFTGGHHGREPRTRIGETTIWRIVVRIAEAAGVDDTSPHRIRHRACTDIVRAGMRATPPLPEEELLYLTGHSNRASLQPYYDASKDREEARGVLNSIDDLIGGDES